VLCLRMFKEDWRKEKSFEFYLRALRKFFASTELKIDNKVTVSSYTNEEAVASSYRFLRESGRGTMAQADDYPQTLFGATCKVRVHSALNARTHLNEYSNKIVVPPSFLEKIDYDQIEVKGSPVTYEIKTKRGMRSYCGVIEFTATDGNAIFQKRLMSSLMIEEGELVQLRMVNLPLGSYAKFRPWSKDFYSLEDPVRSLQEALYHYVTLCLGDTIVFESDGKEIFLDVLALKPQNHVTIMSTLDSEALEFKIEFAQALDYEEEKDPLETPLATESEEDFK